MTVIRYSRWDGSQDPWADADDVLDLLGNDLLESGDIGQALRRMLQQGFTLGGRTVDGLQALRERLRAMRRREQGRYDPDSIAAAIERELDEIRSLERSEVASRMDLPGASPKLQERMDLLDELEGRPADAMRDLQRYDFLSPEAESRFAQLIEQLRQAAIEQMVRGAASMTPQDMARMRAMLAELNAMIRGESDDFAGFMQRYGDMFPDDPQSLEELLDAMRRRAQAAAALFNAMSPEAQAQMAEMMDGLIDPALAREMAELAQALGPTGPRAMPFTGEESMELSGALELLERLQDAEELERFLASVERPGDLDEVDRQRLAQLLGPQSADAIERLRQVERMLEQSGYLRRSGGRSDLTARGIRRLGLQALTEVFRTLRAGLAGEHTVPKSGVGGELTGETKPYEFGDPLHLDVKRTVFEAVRRGLPVRLRPEDFVVERTEHRVQAATALLIDLSLSMPLRGNWIAAKKVALALHALVTMQFPRDAFYIVGFSDYARQVRPEELPGLGWEEVQGTNLEHALRIARRLLSAHPQAQRNIMVVTDGEPTAHLQDDGSAFVLYPPHPDTFAATLREAARCARENMTINTFMLDASPMLKHFVERMTQLARGRAFFTTPERLGEYVLVDFLSSRRTVLRGA